MNVRAVAATLKPVSTFPATEIHGVTERKFARGYPVVCLDTGLPIESQRQHMHACAEYFDQTRVLQPRVRITEVLYMQSEHLM